MNVRWARKHAIAALSVLIAVMAVSGCAKTAFVVFNVDRSGNVKSVHLVQSTGDPALDVKAEALARKNFRRLVAKVPSAKRASTENYVVPVRFE